MPIGPRYLLPARLLSRRWQPISQLLALLATEVIEVSDLPVRGMEEAVVKALKKRAGAHGRSAGAEHRAILAAALLTPARRPLAELLASMLEVGRDDDFERQTHGE